MSSTAEPAVAKPSLATGAKLTAETFSDFAERLKFHCNGQVVKWHHTAAALFTAQVKRVTYGYEQDYAEGRVILLEDSCWFTPNEYWNDLDDEERAELDAEVQELRGRGFLELDEDNQFDFLGERDDHTVTGWNSHWEVVSSHFTKEAAEAFIERKRHDYGELRVFVECQHYAWEFEAIKEAIISGRLQYVEPESKELAR